MMMNMVVRRNNMLKLLNSNLASNRCFNFYCYRYQWDTNTTQISHTHMYAFLREIAFLLSWFIYNVTFLFD